MCKENLTDSGDGGTYCCDTITVPWPVSLIIVDAPALLSVEDEPGPLRPLVLEHLQDDVYLLDSKRPFSQGDKFEYISPDHTSGTIEIGEIHSLEGHYQLRTHVGPHYHVKLAKPLPNLAILRKDVV